MNALFIVASKVFRDRELVGVAQGNRIQTKTWSLVLLDEEPWDALRNVILAVIPSLGAPVIRVGCHNGPCFSASNEEYYQQEHREKSDDLRSKLCPTLGEKPLDVSVWGFHHIDHSLIFTTVKRLKSLPEMSEAEKIIIGDKLLESFRLPTHLTTYDRLSVIKHQLVGLFSPISLELQVMAEQANENRAWTGHTDTLRERLHAKKPEAEDLVKRMKEVLFPANGKRPSNPRKALDRVNSVGQIVERGIRLLDVPTDEFVCPFSFPHDRPDALFQKWLKELDKSLRELREVVNE